MKRSDVNEYLSEFTSILKNHSFHLPPFAFYTVDMWRQQPKQAKQYVTQHRLGWDVTDFNKEDFSRQGLSLFTIRNNTVDLIPPYAEKILHVRKRQITPMHCHLNKIEDIINRGGGQLVIQFQHEDDGDDRPIRILKDHQKITLKPKESVILNPGESVRIPTKIYHSFWAEDKDVLTGEVSMVNDDDHDNVFLTPQDRFSQITEDEKPLYILCNEYENWI